MIFGKNATHDPEVVSWVESANEPGTDFPLQNLPFGVFQHANHETPRIGVAIGDFVLDLNPACTCNLFLGVDTLTRDACGEESLNMLLALGTDRLTAFRRAVFAALYVNAPADIRKAVEHCLVPRSEVTMLLPAAIGDYTDFYASIHHATNVGAMFRPDNPLLPNYQWVPIGYHGRASSIVPSGTPVRRPQGQSKANSASVPSFGPSRLLDYECEVGVLVADGNPLGSSVPIEQAERHMFGLCLVNDWSARDIQTWEYQPLGPFLAKSFCTSISPWVVTMEALVPFRSGAAPRGKNDPAPLPYLSSPDDQRHGGIDLTVEVSLLTTKMREQGLAPQRLSVGNLRDMYWTFAQLLTHHASNGCNLRSGDLLASGTISGREKSSRGCLLELTARGAEPIQLPGGEQRTFLQDGDEVIMRGWCERDGAVRIGFGECRGTIVGS